MNTISTDNKTNKLKTDQPKSSAKWFGSQSAVSFDPSEIKKMLMGQQSCYAIRDEAGRVGMASAMGNASGSDFCSMELLCEVPPYTATQFGDADFRRTYGLKYNYMGGAMANGIASENFVIALGKAGMLGSFGAGGLVISRVAQAIDKIQAALPNGPYAVNLIHSPNETALERDAVRLFLEKKVRVIEASAFMDLTPYVVQYRAAGLSRNTVGSIAVENRVIAKVSRLEVAEKFMRPAPEGMLSELVKDGLITADQAELALSVPIADDITVEADSGGHTDNRPLVNLLPAVLHLREELQDELGYSDKVRVGAAGGISTPSSIIAAYAMGADFIVTGSINQACRESGSSDHVRKALAQAGMTDIMMAPASDMFEMGVKLQVLKKGTLFPLRAQKLYDIYIAHEAWEDVPEKDRMQLEKGIFKNSFENIWSSCIDFFNERDPEQIQRAENNPKRKMALVFRWYLGLSSSWANNGVKGRELDYQIWCGPAMGAFNQWAKGSDLESWESRYVAKVAKRLLDEAAYLGRIQYLSLRGIRS